jgi:hypothetical protein
MIWDSEAAFEIDKLSHIALEKKMRPDRCFDYNLSSESTGGETQKHVCALKWLLKNVPLFERFFYNPLYQPQRFYEKWYNRCGCNPPLADLKQPINTPEKYPGHSQSA